jgi:hypothetical protein
MTKMEQLMLVLATSGLLFWLDTLTPKEMTLLVVLLASKVLLN